MLIVCIIGIFGNAAGIIVFGRQHRFQRHFHTFMLYLAISDFIYIIVSILVFVCPQLSDVYNKNGPYHYIVPWAIPMGQVSMTGSIYFTMGITVERYLTVCHPFYMLSRKWSSRVIVAGITAFAIGYNIPKFLEIGTGYKTCIVTQAYIREEVTKELMLSSITNCSGEITENVTPAVNVYNTTFTNEPLSFNTTKYFIQPSEMRLNSWYVQVYAVYLNFFVNGVGPFTLLIILNVLILKELQNSGLALSPHRQRSYGKCGQILMSNIIASAHYI